MMKFYRFLNVFFVIVCSVASLQALAQSARVTGKVTSSDDGSGLPGVSILEKGTSNGTVTDADGGYSINVGNDAVLVFSFVGYASQEVAVSGRTQINVILETDVTALSEVVIVGYGEVKKEDATGAITSVSSKDFNKGAITSPQDLLMGKSAGVVITTAGGAPGSGSTIRIRGGSSLNASNDPLIIIDGVPIENTNIAGSSNFLSVVNPNDIETFTVLKDASATAIYGSRASNGVIIITTKKGGKGGLQVDYNLNASVASPMKYMDVYSGDELRKIAFDHKDLYGVDALDKLWNGNTNWQKEIFRNAIAFDHNLSLSGAYKWLPYRVSIGYTDQEGILKNTDMKRLTGSINLSPTFLDGALRINVNAKAMNTDNNFGETGAIGSAINMDPTKPVFDGNANSAGYFQWSNYGANLGTPNPVEQLMEADNMSNVKRYLGNFQVNYKLPFVSGLEANLNLATDFTTSEGHNNRPTTSPSVITSPLWGRLSNYAGENKNNLLEFYLKYSKDLTSIKSKLDVTGGYSWQHFEREGDTYTRGVVDEDHAYSKTDSSMFITESFIVSFFGRLNYTLKDKYIATFTVRQDGSSRFGEGNQWGLFPSAALAWKIKDESFLKNVNALSDLKLRLGWGITGQQDITDNDYPSQASYVSSSEGSYYIIDGKFIPTLRPAAYDPNIKWEETTTQNLGIDFGFLDNRIKGSFEIYNRVTDNLINRVTIPTGSNFSNTLLTNVGSLENNGVEVSLTFLPIEKENSSLEIGFNFTHNKNKITRLLLNDDPDYIGVLYGDAFTGQKQVTRVGYPAFSYFVNKQVYYENGSPVEGLYVDLSGDGGTVNGDNADKYIYNNPVADYLMGLSARYSYKNFDISASGRISIGNYVYNQVAAGASYDQMSQIGYWRNFTKQLDDTQFVKRQFTSDYFVQNASFFKMDNISAGYKFENITSRLSARLSFTVQNLFFVTKYKGIDPEVQGGIDNNFYPRPRTFMLGVSLSY